MKMMAVLLLSMFVLGCAEKNDEVFSLEEANKCLFDSDKKAVLEAVVWIKKADVAKDEKEAVEHFEKAYETSHPSNLSNALGKNSNPGFI